jgi:antitoxin component YwqK of YwqJK toxin-antitoxin module
METEFKEKKRMVKFFTIIGIIVASATISWGIHYFKHGEIRVVKAKYENGMDKEVWVYKKNIFGKEKKIKEMTYFDNGNMESEVDYKNGKVNGWARMWYKNGKLHVEATYKNNKTHGIRTAYHENGQVFCRAKYKNGKLLHKKNWDEKGNEIYLPVDRD